MASLKILRRTLGQNIAENLIADIRSNRNKYYYFFGKSIPTIANQIAPADSLAFEAQVRNEIVFMNRISPSDVCAVIPRISWQALTVYTMYTSHDVPTELTYYCVNSDNSVYKCLDNNGGAASTIEPTSIGVDPLVLSDGYKWKFLYNIPLALRNKFSTGDYIPVVRSLNNRFFNEGSIESINFADLGAGYTAATTTIVVNGDGQGAKINPVIVNGQIVDVVIVDPGRGYSFANIRVESTRIITRPAVLTANLSLGDVNTPQSLVEMLSIPGTIDSISIKEGGVSYSTANVVITGDGTDAAATAVISGGVITKITVTNTGTNYTYANISVTGNGTGAELLANVSPAFGHGRNAIAELPTNMVMFYQNFAQQRVGTILINNDFSQYGLIKNPLNKNLGRNVTNALNEFSYSAKCVFAAGSSLVDFPVGSTVYIVRSGSNKVFTVTDIMSGLNGVGIILNGIADEVLNADTVYLQSNPAKQFTVETSVKLELADSQVINCCYTVSGLTDTSLFPADTTVISNTKEFRVISVDAVNNKLLLMPLDNGVLSTGSVINKKDSLIQFTITELAAPDIDRRTGEILFIEDRDAFNQTVDQSVTFRTVLQF